MKAYAVFEERKDKICAHIGAAGSAKDRIAAAQMELEQIANVLAQKEEDSTLRQRQQAVFALVKRSPSLLDTVEAHGEMIIDGMGTEKSLRFVFKLLGAVVLLGLAVYQFVDGQKLCAIVELVGALLLLLGTGARLLGVPGLKAHAAAQIDAKALTARLGELCSAADVCVSDMGLIEKEACTRISGTADDAMLELLAMMLEAKTSGKSEAAVRVLSQAEQYLHMLGLQPVMYSEENEKYFDILPTVSGERTIRPALMKDGKIVRRGVAARQMGRSVGA